MYKKLNILDESDKHLRKISVDAKLPLSKEYKKIIKQIIDELTYSQIEELAEKYDLRPVMGLAFPQLGINERIIIIVHEVDEGKFDNYVMVNPKIISTSEEMIAAEAGEGCLSVNRDVPGHVKRHARVTVEGYDDMCFINSTLLLRCTKRRTKAYKYRNNKIECLKTFYFLYITCAYTNSSLIYILALVIFVSISSTILLGS